MIACAHILREAAEILGKAGLSWSLLGGWAVSVRTEPRFTRDVDLAVAVGTDREAESVVQSFGKRGYIVTTLVEQDAVHRMATARLAPPRTDAAVLLDLLFASSGIEREICEQAEPIEVLPGLMLPVAKAHHLLALKILARDDRTRPQDAGDIRALIRVLDPSERASARQALGLITERGFHRGRSLVQLLDEALALFEP